MKGRAAGSCKGSFEKYQTRKQNKGAKQRNGPPGGTTTSVTKTAGDKAKNVAKTPGDPRINGSERLRYIAKNVAESNRHFLSGKVCRVAAPG